MADKVITTALARFKLAEEAERDIRSLSLDDTEFAKDSKQWPAEIAQSRSSPDNFRPCLVINRLPQFTRQVTNDQRMNRPSLKIDPTDETTVETAQIMEGLARHIQTASNSDIAIDTACDSQVTGGFGYFRVITEYSDEMSFDQDIKIKRIKNPFTVYFDPFAMEPDYSDAKWCFVVTDIPKDQFKDEYKGEQQYSDEVFQSEGNQISQWMSGESIRIAEYFEIEEKEKTIYLLSNGQIVDQKPDESIAGVSVVNDRTTTERKVIWRKITCLEVLEEKEWPGKYIPIIPVLGEDSDVNGKRVLKGMVRDAKDPQRMYNFWASAQAEAIALAPKAPFVAAAGQINAYSKIWKRANTEAVSVLPYDPVTIDGIAVPPPQRMQAEPPVQAMVQAMAQASEDLKNTTGIYSAGLGKREGDASGVALKSLQKEGDVSNFHFIDNLSRSIRYLGIILLDLIPKIYDAPRVIRILHEDGESEIIKINQMFDHKGQSVNYDLTVGKYDVVVNTGPSFTTKRQEAADSMTSIIQSAPELLNIMGDIMFRNMDLPQSQEMADRMKKMLPPQLQDNEGQPQVPPEVQQQMQQANQMVEQLTQALNAAHDQLESKDKELASKEKIASENNETKIIIAEIQNHMKAMGEELTHMREHNKMGMQQEQAERQAQIAEEAAKNQPEPVAA